MREIACRAQVFVHTNKNVLFTVSPKCRIPRTFKRFAGLMGEWRGFSPAFLDGLLIVHHFDDRARCAQCNCCTG